MGSVMGAASGVAAGGTAGGTIAYVLASDGQCVRAAMYGTAAGAGVGVSTADLVDGIIRNNKVDDTQ